MKQLYFLFIFLLLWLVSCGGEESVETATAVPPTITATSPAQATDTAVSPPTHIPEPTPDPFVQGTNGYPWWNDSSFYQILVRSFKDSDGDGIGDLQGIIQQLDYLNDGDPTTTDDLGITGLWLMPIFESPSYHGYDVTDYMTVDPDYGTNEDFQQLIEEAHKRGIRVILDLPLNHTSAEHPWFVDSASSPDSELRDWYIWEAENPGYRGPWGQTVWHREGEEFYYAVFWDQMPDLNFNNPEVSTAVFDVMRFWQQEMGADGFRVDGAKHLMEAGEAQENVAQTHEWFQQFYQQYKANDPDAFVVGEIWSPTSAVSRYIENQDEMDTAFEFDLAAAALNSARGGFAGPFTDQMERVLRSYPAGQYATFLANHDMDRTLTQLGGDEGKAKVAATLQLTSPGVPFIYYGEEIGMTGERTGDTDEPRRLPMQWNSDSTTVGFTDGRPWKAVARDYETRSVALQTDDPNSLLSHYRTLIHLRSQHEALRVGEWAEVKTGNGRVYAALRYTDNETLLIIVNLSIEEQSEYALTLAEGPLSDPVSATLLMGEGEPTPPVVNETGGFDDYQPLPILPPQSSTIIQLSP